MEQKNEMLEKLTPENIIATAITVPGVKVVRSDFLKKVFEKEDVDVQNIIDLGPVEAGISQEKLFEMAKKLILKRTSESSAISFAAAIPGGAAMAASIPGDVIQFFAFTLRIAQELSYLYGADDIWQDGQVDDEKVKNRLLMYCGVMFGVAGAVNGVRVLSAQVAKTTAKQLQNKALMKTGWYPLVKKIGKVIGVNVTKKTLAGGVEKVIPVVGGVVSGGLNFASMMPMANRLQQALESAAFGYTQEDYERDIIEIESIELEDGEETSKSETAKDKIVVNGRKMFESVTGLISKQKSSEPTDDIFEKIEKLSALKEKGIITSEDFEAKKKDLLEMI